MAQYILNKEGLNNKENPYTLSKVVPIELKGEAELILKSYGLNYIKPKFYNIDLDKVALEQEDEPTIASTFNGTPVFDAVTIQNPANDGNDLILPIAIITANQEKNIVKTKIQGRNGNIYEYINNDDWVISIKGVLVNNNMNKRPSEELKRFEIFRNLNQSLGILSNFLDDLGVTQIIIANIEYQQREGMRNVYDYTISCYSETPFELKNNA